MKHLLPIMALMANLLPSVWADGASAELTPSAKEEEIVLSFHQASPSCFGRSEPAPPDEIEEILKQAGVKFGPGARAMLFEAPTDMPAALGDTLYVWNTPTEIEKVKAYFRSRKRAPERNVITIFERIEVERAFLNQWLLEHALDRDGTPMRNAVQKLIRADRAIVLDTVVIACRSGQRAKIESLSEYIYPGEASSEIPKRGGEKNDPAAGKIVPPPTVPTTFWVTRNTGFTLEVEPLISGDPEVVDVNLAPEIVRLAGFESSTPEGLPPERRVRMPVFHAEKIASQITLSRGHYGFLGSTDPLEASREDAEDPVVLSFVRVDVAEPIW